MEFLTGKERSHWAICTENCVLFLISRAAFLKHYASLSQIEKEVVFANIETA
jgi:hypothetical protein